MLDLFNSDKLIECGFFNINYGVCLQGYNGDPGEKGPTGIIVSIGSAEGLWYIDLPCFV